MKSLSICICWSFLMVYSACFLCVSLCLFFFHFPSDMACERNELMQNVYPMLKDYCREKHGMEFQVTRLMYDYERNFDEILPFVKVIDMRWGVRSERQLDHKGPLLCYQEISTCQSISMGPSFIVRVCWPLLSRMEQQLKKCASFSAGAAWSAIRRSSPASIDWYNRVWSAPEHSGGDGRVYRSPSWMVQVRWEQYPSCSYSAADSGRRTRGNYHPSRIGLR